MRLLPSLTQEEEFNVLGSLGYSGSINDRQSAYLYEQGFSRAIADGLKESKITRVVSDFQNASVGFGFNGQILQGTGASVSRIADAVRGGGNFCGQFLAGPKSGSVVGKSLLYYHTPTIVPYGSVVKVDFDIYFPSASTASWDGQKFFDLENNSVVNSPGIRLTMYSSGGNTGLVWERSKIGEGAVLGPTVVSQPIALDTWHRIRTETRLGDNHSGYAKVWIDDTLVVDNIGATVLTQEAWIGAGGTGDISVGINSLQFGATANSDTVNPCVVLIDNIDWSI